MYSYSKFKQHHKKSYCYKRPLSADYKVLLNGEEIPVYTCRISRYPFNTIWPGHQRPFEQSVEAAFVNIVSDEKINLEVMVNNKYEKAMLKPYSKGIQLYNENGKITFSLSENGSYVLEFDNHLHCLYIFNSKPIAVPEKNSVTHYFGAGIHFPGKITLKSNESVFVDKDALVYGNIYAENAENIHIFGNGIFDDSHEERTGNYCYEEYTNGNIKFYDCKNIRIDGVGMMNSAIWCINLFGCSNTILNDVKVFGQWRYNTDGVDIVNCHDILLENSFIHSFDDTVTIKGIDRYCHIDNRNIHINNCVLWCDWGKCCEIGIETACRRYNNISFENCDILRGGCAAMDISNGDCAEISDVRFENIRVEYNGFDTAEVYQHSDDQHYNAENSVAVPTLLQIRNSPYRTPGFMEAFGVTTLDDRIDLNGITPRNVHGVTVKNINVYYDNGLPLNNGNPDIKICIRAEENTEKFYDISINGITVNGKECEIKYTEATV